MSARIFPLLLFVTLAELGSVTVANRDGLPKRRDGGGVRHTSTQVLYDSLSARSPARRSERSPLM